jgi:hypothetical protein
MRLLSDLDELQLKEFDLKAETCRNEEEATVKDDEIALANRELAALAIETKQTTALTA